MLENLGNIGDFLGGIGVVITLLYLAFQIRLNTRQLKSDSEKARVNAEDSTTSDISRWIGGIVENRDVAEFWVRGLKEIDHLDETDRLRFDYLGMQLLQAWQITFRRSEQPGGHSELWGYALTYFKLFDRAPGFRKLWTSNKGLLMPDFFAALELATADSRSHLPSQGNEDA
jgi:hypothetical protein